MTALVRAPDNTPVAHAIVDDIAEGVARTRIVRLFSTHASIGMGMTIHLSDSAVH